MILLLICWILWKYRVDIWKCYGQKNGMIMDMHALSHMEISDA